ncbi:oligosaccharide flippase family protein [Microbacterium profundi]|uniref:Oligosaccharide flippase family protein n=1 Tax=Microbacterium profundi TaxID=450380 RepID=A0ABV3LL25_9MICO|nr:oligosaccharide flippase family protein [Microbacterium profundi]
MTDTERSLRVHAARGAAWSAVSSIILRLGSLIVGIVLARLLTPEQFGVYAVALTVQSILMTVADLGLSSDLIRSDEPEKIAPTIATLGLVSGATMTFITAATSTSLAQLMGSPEAAPAISVLAFTLVLGSISLVPYSMLMRRFQQRAMFLVGAVDFVISTTVTLTLVFLGFGVMGLAIGRVTAQIVSSTLQFFLAGVRPRYGLDRTRLKPILAFGLPIATANLLAWGLLNVDNVILARMVGVTALGYYVLAFNVSSWPMNALSQSVRAISMPYFSRAESPSSGLATVVAIGWAGALPAGGVLAVLSAPLISVLYGDKWLAAAPVLAALGVYGALRVIFDIFTGFLYARGRAQPVLWIQVLWLVALVIGMIIVIGPFGIVGAGWVHVIVAAGVVLPAYLIVLRQSGIQVMPFVRRSIWPTAAAIAAVGVAIPCAAFIDEPLLALLVGGFSAVGVYIALVWPWAWREWRRIRPER